MDEKKEIRFVDLFGGVGGFRLGLERCGVLHTGGRPYREETALHGKPTETEAGDDPSSVCHRKIFRCVYYNDFDKYATSVYNRRFEEGWEPTDIRSVRTEDVPDHELLCGGFPCQTFSIAGKRKGFADSRGTLFFEIARIVRAKRPKVLFLENVKGLLNHDGGRTFEVILATLDKVGYDAEWQVLNSKDFGVPQNRERVFVVGHLRGETRGEVFPIGGVHGETAEEERRYETEDSIPEIGEAERVYGTKGVSPPMKSHPVMVQCAKGLDRIRRLTPTEFERLQGFPDNWTEGASDTQRYKMMGNTVTVNVIEAIGRKIMEVI